MENRSHCRLGRGSDRERGAATTELVVCTPLLLLVCLLVVQGALAWHAQHLAQYTAQEALAATRAHRGSPAEGEARARERLGAVAGRVLTSPRVTVRRGTAFATVKVEGEVLRAVPGLTLRAGGTASGAVERVTVGDWP
ncbi:pilus assembly protein [Streptomyces sp. AJS327]|uniref:TadE/TadG family type IV pilus assembly protein n=1 Tax=Streptomyces sp. AJS327 TaxID=2545265 RepID=UPI0015DF1750|nr:TadE/TadG family type IV pilus assembly protein [Streptomyces sp. AJS327]MBA0049772.1 pilus assembly protein [Streptomyces sp. AJS327]